MKRITANEFEKLVEENPAWATTLTEPVEIVGHCCLNKSPITHLSPLLHFVGTGDPTDPTHPYVAEFKLCVNLLTAEGTFHGAVNFEGAIAIRTIGEIVVTKANHAGDAVNFRKCYFLKIAAGTYSGHADFSGSDIEKIADLHITAPNREGNAASFRYCPKLKAASGKYTGYVDFTGASIEQIENLHVTNPDPHGNAACFTGCENLKVATGNYPGKVDFSRSGVRIVRRLTAAGADFTGCDLDDIPPGFADDATMEIDPAIKEKLRAIEAQRAAAREVLKPYKDNLLL